MKVGHRLISIITVMAFETTPLAASDIGRKANLDSKHAADALKRILVAHPDYIEVSIHPEGLKVRRSDGTVGDRLVYVLTPTGRSWARSVVVGSVNTMGRKSLSARKPRRPAIAAAVPD